MGKFFFIRRVYYNQPIPPPKMLAFLAAAATAWGKPAPAPPPPPPPGMPTSFIVCTVMWFIHGFVLDVVVIGVLPFLSASASDAQRADKCAPAPCEHATPSEGRRGRRRVRSPTTSLLVGK